MQKRKIKDIYRILDANFNRAKEGLRVCEDVTRFILNDQKLTREFKNIRHQLLKLLERHLYTNEVFIKARDVKGDVGRASQPIEFQRRNVKDIFFANSQRSKESIRVLEEFAKLIQKIKAEEFKRMRYKIYSLEKRVVEKL